MAERCFGAEPVRLTAVKAPRRPGALTQAPAAVCLTPLATRAQALWALRRAGWPDASEPLVAVTRAAARRAAALRFEGLEAEQADRIAVDELDFDDPLVLGPLVSTMPGLDGGRRSIERQIRSLLLRALAGVR